MSRNGISRLDHWLMYRLKRWCDTVLYGQILIPPRHCPGCGWPIVPKEKVTGFYHTRCEGSIPK